MTTHELARILLTGPDVMAVRSGYEGGRTEITGVDTAKPLVLDVNDDWYLGRHEFAEHYETEGKEPSANAILIY